MSTILEALSRAERERRMGQAPTIAHALLDHPASTAVQANAPDRKWLLAAAAGLLCAGLIAAVVYGLGSRQAPAGSVASSTPAAQSAASVASPAPPLASASSALPAAAGFESAGPPAASPASRTPTAAASAPAQPAAPASGTRQPATSAPKASSAVSAATPSPRPSQRSGASSAKPAEPVAAKPVREERSAARPAAKTAGPEKSAPDQTRVQAPEQSPSRVSARASAQASSREGDQALAKATPARTSAAEASASTLPWYQELPPATRQELPTITLGGYIYSANAAERSILINGRLLREGDQLQPGLRLEQMRKDGVVFAYRDLRFRMAY